jgi:hypothetical protein
LAEVLTNPHRKNLAHYETYHRVVTTKGKRRLRVFDDRVLEPKKDEVTGQWRKQLMICNPHQILFG